MEKKITRMFGELEAMQTYNRALEVDFSFNPSGFILGVSGSGVDFASKVDALSAFTSTKDDIIVIDTENSYSAMAKELGGQVIKLEPGSDARINPMEVLRDGGEIFDEMAVSEKFDFATAVCECLMNTEGGLPPAQMMIIDRCVHELYLNDSKKMKDFSSDTMPTLADLQALIGHGHEPEARELFMALQLCINGGSLDMFGEHSNVDANNRFVVYQLGNVGNRLKKVAMLMVLEYVWNKVTQNRLNGKHTWLYINNIELLFANEATEQFVRHMFVRSRTNACVITGISKDVEALLDNQSARSIMANSNYACILKQTSGNAQRLTEIYGISQENIDYMISSFAGRGLIWLGTKSAHIPCDCNILKGSECYQTITGYHIAEGYKKSPDEIAKERRVMTVSNMLSHCKYYDFINIEQLKDYARNAGEDEWLRLMEYADVKHQIEKCCQENALSAKKYVDRKRTQEAFKNANRRACIDAMKAFIDQGNSIDELFSYAKEEQRIWRDFLKNDKKAVCEITYYAIKKKLTK